MSVEIPRKWRLLETGAADGPTNMAVDEAILIHHSRGEVPPTLRFYRWQPPTLSLGHFQQLEREVDREACRRLGVGLVRRPTGGRAVLHEHEVTYSIVLAQKYLPGGVVETYRVLSKGLLFGLHLLGVPAELYSPGKQKKEKDFSPAGENNDDVVEISAVGAAGGNSFPNVRGHLSAACFDAPSWYEVAVEGRKLVGSAQVRQRETILQHGSILLGLDEEKLFRVLAFPSEKFRERVKKTFADRATALDRVLSRPPAYEEVCLAMVQGFEKALGVELVPGALTAEEWATAVQLREEKYMPL